jgi:protein SCO1/2
MRWSVFFTVFGLLAIFGYAAVKWAGFSYTPNIDAQARSIEAQGLEVGDGESFSFSSLKGRPKVVLLGYLSCPDVCPTSLAYMARELDQLGADRHLIQPVFISVDPARDRGAQLTAYVGHFGKDILGLTGTETALTGFAQALGAFFRLEPKDPTTGSYMVNHSAGFYILDGNNRLIATLTPPHDRGALAVLMAKAIRGSSSI